MSTRAIIFEGRLATPAGNKQGVVDVVADSDKCPGPAASVGYHTTIRPCVEGIARAALVLNLFGDRGESAVALRNCMLYFRELTVEGRIVWERHVRWTTKWSSAMKALRLDMCKEEGGYPTLVPPGWRGRTASGATL